MVYFILNNGPKYLKWAPQSPKEVIRHHVSWVRPTMKAQTRAQKYANSAGNRPKTCWKQAQKRVHMLDQIYRPNGPMKITWKSNPFHLIYLAHPLSKTYQPSIIYMVFTCTGRMTQVYTI